MIFDSYVVKWYKIETHMPSNPTIFDLMPILPFDFILFSYEENVIAGLRIKKKRIGEGLNWFKGIAERLEWIVEECDRPEPISGYYFPVSMPVIAGPSPPAAVCVVRIGADKVARALARLYGWSSKIDARYLANPSRSLMERIDSLRAVGYGYKAVAAQFSQTGGMKPVEDVFNFRAKQLVSPLDVLILVKGILGWD